MKKLCIYFLEFLVTDLTTYEELSFTYGKFRQQLNFKY